mmetsp:Transcript_61447/g.171777  ORF Transcript_61447/g.171777 Transcript_61447/m.171777 type:complete len:390 (-) Transcript_61447:12-1181(-)
MTEFRRGIDKLELDFLGSLAAHLGQQGLAQGYDALAWTHDCTTQHHPVLSDFPVMRETAHRRDALFGKIGLRHRAVRVVLRGLADAVDFLVDFCAVVIAALARPWHLELDARRVPRANARDLPKAAVRFARKPGDAPARHDPRDAMALRGADDVDHLVLSEDIRDLHLLFEETRNEVHLLFYGAAVHLYLLDVGLLTPELHLGDLGVANGADHLAVLFRPRDLRGHRRFRALARLAPLFLVLCERLLLGFVPRLVEAPLALFAQVPGPNGSQRPEAPRRLHVAHEPNNDHRRRLEDSHGLRDLFFVQLRARPVHVADDVRHSCLVGQESSEVRGLRLVVLGEALDFPRVVLRTLPWQETQGSVAWPFELPVRHPTVVDFSSESKPLAPA